MSYFWVDKLQRISEHDHDSLAKPYVNACFGTGPHIDSRVIVGYIMALSILTLGYQLLFQTTGKRASGLRERVTESTEAYTTGVSCAQHGYITRHGGANILTYQVLRLVFNMGLMVLVLFRLQHDLSPGSLSIVAAATYVTFLSAIILSKPVFQVRSLYTHSTCTTFAIFLTYAHRNIWLITFHQHPVDKGGTSWIIITLSGITGILIPLCEPYPSNHTSPQEPSPEKTASVLGRILYVYLDPIIAQSRRAEHLGMDMLPPSNPSDSIEALLPRAKQYFDPFTSSTGQPLDAARKINVMWAIAAAFRETWVLQSFTVVFETVAQLGAPIGIHRLLQHIESGGAGASVRPIVWVVLLVLSPLVQGLAYQFYLSLTARWMVHIEAILTSVMYDHALRARILHRPTSTSTLAGSGTYGDNAAQGAVHDHLGRLNNLITSDLYNIGEADQILAVVIEIPLMVIFSTLFLYTILGNATWVGLGVMIIFMPVPAWFGRGVNEVQKQRMKASDARIESINEVLNVIRMIKQFGWEDEMKRVVEEKRAEELHWILKGKFYVIANIFINCLVPLIHMVVTYAYFALVQHRPLTSAVIFSSLTAFHMVRMAIFRIVYSISQLIQAKVSLGRVQDFLNDTELLDRYFTSVESLKVPSHHIHDIGMANISFSWSSEALEDNSLPLRSAFRLRIEEPIIFKRGAVNLITGPTGSGKTALLMALLGEMHLRAHDPDSWVNLPRIGNVAFCTQESWVQSMSIRENILLGAKYDKTRYKKVVEQCGLLPDLDLFEAGDLTTVGEKGITLSGGQKARIALARAVYSEAQILLFDDVLAALDVHTATWIVEKCLKGDLMRSRTVLLVTHHITLVAPIASFVVSIAADSSITTSETPREILSLVGSFAVENTNGQLDNDFERSDPHERRWSPTIGSKLRAKEETSLGRIGWTTWRHYFTSLSSRPLLFWCSYLGIRSINEAAEVYETWWLGYWARAYESMENVDVPYYLTRYIAILAFIFLTYSWCSGIFSYASVRAGRLMHIRLVGSILASTFRWLDVTPTSRIITRCTQDIQSLDDQLGAHLNMSILLIIKSLSRLLAVAASAPVFILPWIVMGLMGSIIGQLYVKAQLSVKRERSNAKSPVLAEVNDTQTGLASIRAFGVQNMFRQHFMNQINRCSHISVMYWNLNRWVAVRIQLLSTTFAGALITYLVYGPGSEFRSASMIGFALNMADGFSGNILMIVRELNSLEVEANSLERIQSYIENEQEPQSCDVGPPPAYWPATGDIRVKNLTARYSPDGPVVLDQVSVDIRSGERIGIVGRTGSGKSTFALALLRCIYTEGEVYIDNLPTSTLNLSAFRSKVSIIPQAPQLLAGNLRRNLDMFGDYDDAELNSALRSVGLVDSRVERDGARLTLDTHIANGGENLSVGQRQLIAIARALLRRSKILVLDEATSAIDQGTESFVQSTLQTLGRDVTVIVIAHRLKTIMDSDKIIVFDSGRLIEYAAPCELLQRKDSNFRALVDESMGKDEFLTIPDVTTVSE